MAKTFPKFGPYTIIADTNALCPKDQRKLVSGSFEKALTELRKLATVQLIIPQVVVGELAYQRFILAKTALEVANNKLAVLAEITGVTQPKLRSIEQVKKRILKRYDAWCKAVNARRFAPKVKHSIWNGVVEDAVWRIPPFEHSEDGKHEKGFRDRVVLEAILQSCSASTNETVFLCNDGMLKTAVLNHGLKNLTIVPRLEDYESRIRLLKEKATQEWVDEVFKAATKEFYTDDNDKCLYWREKIFELINARVADLQPPTSTGGLGTELFQPKTWERQTQEHITLGTTQFEKFEGGRYRWKTEVSSVAAFSGKSFLNVLIENIRISTFSIHWSSKKTPEAEIQEAKLEDIELAGKRMILDTAESRSEWSLPAKPVSLPQSIADALKGISLFTPPN